MPTQPETAGLLSQLTSFGLGAWGSALALARTRELGWWPRLMAFTTALSFSAMLPPFITYALKLPFELGGPLAFVCGYAGLGLAAALLRISQDPIGAWRRLRGDAPTDGGPTP